MAEPSRGRGPLRRAMAPFGILIGNRSLWWLVLAFSAVTLAEWGFVTALAIDAYRRAGTFAVGLVGLRLVVGALASVGLTPPLVERVASGRLLTLIAATRGVLLAAVAVLAASGASLAPLLIVAYVDAVVAAMYRPAQSTVLPAVARNPTELAASAAGLSTAKTLSQALGGGIGGSLLALTTPTAVFAGAAVVFGLAALMTLGFARRQVGRRAVRGAGRHASETLRTATVVRDNQVGGILVVSGLRTFVRGMWISMAVIVSLRLLHAGSAGVGLLMLAAGIGSLTAVPISATLMDRARIGTAAALALAGCGVPLALIAGVPIFEVALVLIAVWGIGMAVADVATLVLTYRLLSTHLLPRVTGAIESAKLGLEGLGAFLGPALVAAFGIRAALLLAAVPLPVAVVGTWRALHRVDASAGERHRVLELLHSVPCLAPLDVVGLEALAGRTVPMTVEPATDVVRQGDPGDLFYLVVSGTAEVLVSGFRVGEVGPGGSFGEKALLRNTARTATVRSMASMELLALSREDFLGALTEQEAMATEAPIGPQSARGAGESRRQRIEFLSGVNLVSHLDGASLSRLAAVSTVDRWPKGATIVRRGDHGDRFYVMLEGGAAVIVDGRPVGELRPGDQFGEIALLHDVPRQADVVTTDPALTLSIHRDDLLPEVRTRVVRG